MINKKHSRFIFVIIACILSVSFVSPGAGQTPYTNFVYFPLVKTSPPISIFGAEISPGNFASVSPMIQDSGIYWVRMNGLLWSQVQPTGSNEWNWQIVSSLEANLVQASSLGTRVVLVIRSTPTWAQQVPGLYCGPMQRGRISAFANFVHEAVKRYSNPPYNVNYYEIWNEPDAPPMANGDSIFGCWGNQNDPYYGGGYYAEMLKQVYPAVKNANQNAQLLIGGLLLDCDPTSVTGGCAPGKGLPPLFFKGILVNGGGAYFDIVNFHGYTHYATIENPIFLEKNFSSWKTRGGVVEGKISYLREVMASFGVNKPIFQSEAALLLNSSDSTVVATFEDAKTDYLVWVYTRNIAEGLIGTTWYTMDGPGWRSSGLLDTNQAPLGAYKALKFAVNELAGRTYRTSVNSYPGIEGFEFSKGSGKIWVLFSQDNYSHTITVPSTVNSAYDVQGIPVNVGGELTIFHPIYLELNQ